MTATHHELVLDEAALERLAALIGLDLRPGDTIALAGDLGAGKTTFARSAIRSALADPEAEVPSPTFSLLQLYDTPRGQIAHCDLYRIDDASAVAELGLDDALARGALLVEWPERAAGALPGEPLEIAFAEADGGDRRRLALAARGDWIRRIDRLLAVRTFAERSGWGSASIGGIPGDASSRRYFRLVRDGARALLMDAPRMPDGPPIRDGRPYSRIAHLAEDVRPFVAVARHLAELGLSAPAVLDMDLDAGLLLIEDLGDNVFGPALVAGADQRRLWRGAVDALLVLHRSPPRSRLPVGDGSEHEVPLFDREALQIELELLLDWYVPALEGGPPDPTTRADFLAAWQPVLDRLLAEPATLLLRDFHSPNLLWLPEREGARRTGIIDFQDAMIGPAAYDLVSLLQDARLDVPEAIERELLEHYALAAERTRPGFDRSGFELAYRALGAQRNTKILGIFARLARRDGKIRYLQHIPRIWRYLERDLAHPGLSSLAAWYDRHLPPADRARPITT